MKLVGYCYQFFYNSYKLSLQAQINEWINKQPVREITKRFVRRPYREVKTKGIILLLKSTDTGDSFWKCHMIIIFSLLNKWHVDCFLQPSSSPLSYNSYQPGRWKANTCFLRNMWSQPIASFHTAARAVSQSRVTPLEKCCICPLLHTRSDRCLRLASVAVTDRRESIPSLPPRSLGVPAMDGC